MTQQPSDHLGREGEFDLDWQSYQHKSVVACCVGWLKQCRRVGMRFEKLAGSFLRFVKLAIIERYLRNLDPSDRT